MQEVQAVDAAPMEKTPPLPGQECFLFSYVLLNKPVDGVLGFVKFISAHGDIDSMKADYARAEPTNKQCFMKWGETGIWEVLRDPLTDTEGTIDLVRLPGDDDEFMGEKLTRHEVIPAKKEAMFDRGSIDQYKQNVKLRKAEEKRLELRKKATSELQEELDDKTSLSSYAELQWRRLTQKSVIADCQSKLEEAQVALRKTLKELHNRRRRYPHYENKWQNEIRRIHKLMAPKQADNNPVDRPVASLGYEDDDQLANHKSVEVEDEFDTGVGIEMKNKEESKEEKGKDKEEESQQGLTELIEEDNKLKEKIAKLEDEIEEKKKAVAASFMPNAPIKTVGPAGNSKKKKKNKNKK